MKIILYAFLLFAPSCMVVAAIGDTPRKFAANYGMPKVVNEREGTLTYDYDGKHIIAHFENGRCDYFLLSKLPNPISGIVATVTEAEQQVLRAENAGGHQWLKEKQLVGDDMIWQTSDFAIVADYDEKAGVWGVFTFKAYVIYSAKKVINKSHQDTKP